MWTRLWANSVDVPGPHIERFIRACAEHGIYCVLGVNERESDRPGSLYNTMVLIGPEGFALETSQVDAHDARTALLRRRLRTGPERHGVSAVGRVGGLICWENRMPLAGSELYRQGVQIWTAPTADDADGWTSTMSHIAIESGAFVVSAPQYIPRSAFPEDFPVQLPDDGKALGRGGAAIFEPLQGRAIAGPLYDQEGIVVADVDLGRCMTAKRWFDVVGHYSREDVLRPPARTRSRLRTAQHQAAPTAEPVAEPSRPFPTSEWRGFLLSGCRRPLARYPGCGGATSGTSRSGGRPGFCLLSGRWGSTAGRCRQRRPRGPCPRTPGTLRPPGHGPHVAPLDVLESLGGLPLASPSGVPDVWMASYRSWTSPGPGTWQWRRGNPGRVQDLVAVGIPDPGDHAWLRRTPLICWELGRGSRPGIGVEPWTERIRAKRRDARHVVGIPDHIDRQALFRARLGQVHATRAAGPVKVSRAAMCPLPIFSWVSVGESVKRTQPARARWKTKDSPSVSMLTNLPKRRTPVTVLPSSSEIRRICRLEHGEGDDLDFVTAAPRRCPSRKSARAATSGSSGMA